MTVLDRISVRPNDDGGHSIVLRSERPPVTPATRREINPNPYARYNEPRIREGPVPHSISQLHQSGHTYGAHPVNEPDTPLRFIDYRANYPYPVDDEPVVRSGPARLLQHSGGYYDSYDEPAVRDGPTRPLQHSGNYYDFHDEPVVRSGPVRHSQQNGNYFDPYKDPAVRDGLVSSQPYTYNPYLADREPEVLEGRVRPLRRSENYYDPYDEPAVRSGPARPLQHSGHYYDPYEEPAVPYRPPQPQYYTPAQYYTYNRHQGGHEPEILDGAGRRPQPQGAYSNLPMGPQPFLQPNGTTVWVPRPPAPNAGPSVPGVSGYVHYDSALRGAPEQYRMQGRQQIDPHTVRRGAWGGYNG